MFSHQHFSNANAAARFEPMKGRTLDIAAESGHGDLTGTIKNFMEIR